MIDFDEIKRALSMGWSLPILSLYRETSMGKANIDVHTYGSGIFYAAWWYDLNGSVHRLDHDMGSIDAAINACKAEYARRISLATAGAENVDADGREVSP